MASSLSIEVIFDVLDCVVLPPVRVLAQRELPKSVPYLHHRSLWPLADIFSTFGRAGQGRPAACIHGRASFRGERE
jgi:hypothetical protein